MTRLRITEIYLMNLKGESNKHIITVHLIENVHNRGKPCKQNLDFLLSQILFTVY